MNWEGLAAPEPLLDHHDLAGFDSGQPSLDDWLRGRALANQTAGASRCFVVCRDRVVVGYYTLSAFAVAAAAAPGRIRRNMPDPIPMVLVGRLAVDRPEQGAGLGRLLLRDAVLRARSATEVIAARGMLVRALDEHAAGFYRVFGFKPSPVEPLLLMATFGDLDAAG